MAGGLMPSKLKRAKMWNSKWVDKWRDKVTRTTEVVANLWYCRDREGFIYSLRAKPYVIGGSEKEKLEFLQERALLDYLIAESFEIPEGYHTRIQDGHGHLLEVSRAGHISTIQDTPLAIFEDALKVLEERFPAQSNLSIPQDPIVCTTPLMRDESGRIMPNFAGKIRYDQ